MDMNKKKEALRWIREMSAILNDRALQPDDIPRIVLQALDQVMGFQNSMIFLVDEIGDRLLCVSARGVNAVSPPQTVGIGEGIVGVAARKGNLLRINNIQAEIEDGAIVPDGWTAAAFRSQLAIPLFSQEAVIGVLSVQCESLNAFDEMDEELLVVIANQTSQVLNAVRMEMLHRKQRKLMGDSLAHLQLLQKYMEALATALPEQESFSRAAAFQLKGLAYLSMGEAQLAFEQLETALKLWDHTGLPLEIARGDRPQEGAAPSGLTERKLSKREQEVASLAAVGFSNAEIAGKLYVSERTVTTHLERIYRKLDIHSRAALAHYMANRS